MQRILVFAFLFLLPSITFAKTGEHKELFCADVHSQLYYIGEQKLGIDPESGFDFQTADDLYETCIYSIDSSENFVEAQRLRAEGRDLTKRGYYNDARLLFLEAALIAPSNPLAIHDLAQMYMWVKKSDTALMHYSRLERYFPQWPGISILVAEAAYNADEISLAIQALARAIERQPEDPMNFEILAKLDFYHGNYEDCLESLDSYFDRAPASSSTLSTLATCHRLLGNIRSAFEVVKLWHRMAPSSPGPWAELGQICEADDRLKCAEFAYAEYRRIVGE